MHKVQYLLWRINHIEAPEIWLCVVLHSAKKIHCVSADEVPWPQESPTNSEKPHLVITNTLKISLESNIGYTSVYDTVITLKLIQDYVKENAVKLIEQ